MASSRKKKSVPLMISMISRCNGTTTEQAFVPGHLSRQPLGPGQQVAFVPGPTASRVSGGPRPFVPVVSTNRDKMPLFCLGWCLQPGQKALAPYPLPSPPARAFQLTCFMLFSAREGGVLAHFFTTFVKIFDSPVHPSALKVWGLFFSSFIAYVAHFMLQKQ